jgi:hypothetical protein
MHKMAGFRDVRRMITNLQLDNEITVLQSGASRWGDLLPSADTGWSVLLT